VIGYLRGIARSRNTVDVGGVGYVVHTPSPLVVGDEVELHVHTQVREDAITLYGFEQEAERAVFEGLVKVSGVGPQTALTLVAGLGASGVAAAIRRRDVKALGAIKGVGPKMAEKIVLFTTIPDGVTGDERVEDLTRTLVSLGWDRNTATDAAGQAVQACGDDASEEQIVSAAIAYAGAVKL
jgi:holliday junction DNA helicase RuvA